ncbi:Hypp8509 [Branchiostoma lanceolatum]|uniref:Hypp8509 protein n=1 Tax=Branchiostoma lanceolatum TaxID=7740 RepID=A0A8K0EDN4_BRALA|nr:Hypp8509 [Branchiostoma lanceolatum]
MWSEPSRQRWIPATETGGNGPVVGRSDPGLAVGGWTRLGPRDEASLQQDGDRKAMRTFHGSCNGRHYNCGMVQSGPRTPP